MYPSMALPVSLNKVIIQSGYILADLIYLLPQHFDVIIIIRPN